VSDSAERRICDATWSKVRALTWAMLPAPALYVVIGLVLLRRKALPQAPLISGVARAVLFYSLVAASVACLAVARWVSTAALSEAFARRRLKGMHQAAQHFQQVHLIVFGLGALPAVMGLAYFLLTGGIVQMTLLAGLSVLFLLFSLPSRRKLETLVRSAGRAGATPP
jgi:hypothetical protein